MCGSPPDAPKLPEYPGLSDQEKGILAKEGLTLDQFNELIKGGSTSLEQNKNILQQISGLYDAQGNLDQRALADLKARTTGQLTQAQNVGSAALQYLNNYFGGGGGAGTSPSIAQAQSETYLNALNGTGAINEATKQQQARDFQVLKDSLAQRGIMVTGDTPAQATSDSTAGQRAIQMFQQNIAAQNSQERLGYINTLGGQVQGTLGAAQGNSTMGLNATNTALGYSNSAATNSLSTLAPYLQAYQQGLQQYYQPYQQQRLGQYQQAVDQANMNYTAGLNQYQATQGQIMGWANLAAGAATKAYGAYAGSAGASQMPSGQV